MEKNIIIKDWGKIDISFGLIYPNIQEVGMSSYAVRYLYSNLNTMKDVACERIFLPDSIQYPASADNSDINLLRSIENKILPDQFDILGFSVQYENDFKNILWILEKSGIPLSYKERELIMMMDKTLPIIIGGGTVITSNPLPLSQYFDLLFIGDSEINLNLFLDLYKEYKNNNFKYSEFLKRATLIEGIYVPYLNNKPKRAIIQDLNPSDIPYYQIINHDKRKKKIFQQNFLLEINRGCPFQCKFCISSFHNSPFRNRDYENIINTIDSGLKTSHFERISLIGSCISAHPRFKDICEYIVKKGLHLTIPSIRIEHIDKEIIEILEKAKIKTITIAPETGSEELRFKLGKKISNETIFSKIKLIKDSSINNIKFYFLIGLPNENEDDVNQLISFLKTISEMGFNKQALRVNINPFIPKFNTPYENHVDFFLASNDHELNKKFKKLEQNLNKIPSIKIKFQNYKKIIKSARIQSLLSLGDQEISKLLQYYYFNGANFGGLRRAQKEMGIDINEYFKKIQSGYHPWNI